MRLFAVAGNPILHSRSPLIFLELFKSHAVDADYTRLCPESPEELFSMAALLGLEGLNITSPFKESAYHAAEEWDDSARKTRSVNTVVLRGGKKRGFNTDPDGVFLTLTARGVQVRGKKTLVLGAGGAGRAAALALTRMKAEVILLNRTVHRAEEYASLIGCRASGLESLSLHVQDAFLVVNTLPEIKTRLKDMFGEKQLLFFDAVYPDPALESFCRQRGSTFIPGEEWLVRQACRSFEIFTGIHLPGDEIDIERLRKVDSLSRKKNISLIGLMGCGKTSAGKRLAQKLGFIFLDTDSEIERAENMSVGDIFRVKGEAYFRKKEKEVISCLWREKNRLYACGGGAVLDEDNRRALKENSVVVWLLCSPEASALRLRGEMRPLLQGDDPVEMAARLFRQRKEKYFITADLILYSGKKSEEVAAQAYEEIVRTL